MPKTVLTDTDIANFAMDILGEEPFGELAAPVTAPQRTVQRLYPVAVEAAMKEHRWLAARAVKSCNRYGADEQFGSRYQLPGDCALVWTVNDYEDGWFKVDGQDGDAVAFNGDDSVRVVYGRILPAGETPVELALYVGAVLAELAASSAGLEISARRKQQIVETMDDRLDRAVAIVGVEGGRGEEKTSRFVDAAHGFAPERGRF